MFGYNPGLYYTNYDCDTAARFDMEGYGDRYDHRRASELARPEVRDQPAEPMPKDQPAEPDAK